jgi:hypothetical protein
LKEKFDAVFDGLLMYGIVLLGVMMSRYIPIFREGGAIQFDFSWPRLIVGCLIAFMVLTGLEQMGDKKGRRKNKLRRAIAALSLGAFWYNMIGG